jgi:hypothetical protein
MHWNLIVLTTTAIVLMAVSVTLGSGAPTGGDFENYVID